MLDFFSSPRVMLALGNIITISIYRYMFESFYEKREYAKKHKWIEPIVLIADCILLTFANYLGFAMVNVAAMFVAYMIPLLIMYKLNTFRGIAYYFFFFIGNCAVEIVLTLEQGAIFAGMGLRTEYKMMTPLSSGILSISSIVIGSLLCKFGNKERDKRYNKLTLLFMIMPVITLIIFVVDMIMLANGTSEDINPGQFGRLVVLLLFFNIVIFLIEESYTKLFRRELDATSARIKAENETALMELAANALRERLKGAEETTERDKVMRHDRRHFEGMLLMLLEEGKYEEAKAALKNRMDVEPRPEKKYCNNVACNAAIIHYINKATAERIRMDVSTDIPAELSADSIEFAIVISNLLENAIHATKELPEDERMIRIVAKYKRQLILEVENTCVGTVELDEDGKPVTRKIGHGVGTKSICDFVEKNEGAIDFISEEGCFKVRMFF